MGFRINTNVAALNAKANSDLNSKALDQSLARLSSGLRINSAADDASGMAIADSLRSQASTLGQAISNGNDALGILQTADKAMDEQLKILDTIKTKATQAAQDGQSLKTRTMLQADINRLMEELDNIANTTSFNGKQLLSGNFINQEFQIGASSNSGSGYSVGSGKNYSTGFANAIAISAASQLSAVYNVSAGSGFSSGSNLSQFATMKTTAFGVKDETAGVTTLKGAMAVMDIAETATTNLDQIRADIGSVQNQLQVTINNITVTQVNVKAAESTIRDVDFAAESANFSKYNILAQSGSYAMSQANAVQQNVLKLLQ
ncbi:hypothetical protein AEI05_09670 [Campylobacter jejuni]|uniref:flagellin N-terminal helical domain-containing protein n=1 Tax=Campylobacter jejuni TaxID=197 RepID=UPI0021AD5B0A|nr:flagellin [Campylobacter jejuni]UWN05756.1 hypothetical protein AEI05_09670 [Campylobacter jejuni]